VKSMIKGLMFFCTVFFVTSVFGEDVKPAAKLVFPGYKAVGELSSKEKELYFKEIGEKLPKTPKGNIKELHGVQRFGSSSSKRKPYEHTECQIGYLPFSTIPGNALIPGAASIM
jgi:hypothetical protein